MITQHYEIHDDTGPIFKGTAYEVIHIWNCLWGIIPINEEYNQKFEKENPIKKWKGSLKVFALIDEMYLKPGKHSIKEFRD